MSKPMETKLPVTYNNTDKSPEEIEALPIVGIQMNNWRQRRITLHADPDADSGCVYSIGKSFDGRDIVIALEPRAAFCTALDYWKHGEKVFTSD